MVKVFGWWWKWQLNSQAQDFNLVKYQSHTVLLKIPDNLERVLKTIHVNLNKNTHKRAKTTTKLQKVCDKNFLKLGHLMKCGINVDFTHESM